MQEYATEATHPPINTKISVHPDQLSGRTPGKRAEHKILAQVPLAQALHVGPEGPGDASIAQVEVLPLTSEALGVLLEEPPPEPVTGGEVEPSPRDRHGVGQLTGSLE